MGIGHDTVIERTIVDKNARIGDHVRITPDGKPSHLDGANFHVRDGIVVIPKNAIVPDGTVI
jgi:glucose-1-phosphate adenylyltransferase